VEATTLPLKVKLLVVKGAASQQEIEVKKLPLTIGRAGGGLVLNHPLVSRRHCQIFQRNQHLYVKDLGSANGTLLGPSMDNQQKITEALMQPGDYLTVGPLTFTIYYNRGQNHPSEDLSPPATSLPATSPPANGAAASPVRPPANGVPETLNLSGLSRREALAQTMLADDIPEIAPPAGSPAPDAGGDPARIAEPSFPSLAIPQNIAAQPPASAPPSKPSKMSPWDDLQRDLAAETSIDEEPSGKLFVPPSSQNLVPAAQTPAAPASVEPAGPATAPGGTSPAEFSPGSAVTGSAVTGSAVTGSAPGETAPREPAVSSPSSGDLHSALADGSSGSFDHEPTPREGSIAAATAAEASGRSWDDPQVVPPGEDSYNHDQSDEFDPAKLGLKERPSDEGAPPPDSESPGARPTVPGESRRSRPRLSEDSADAEFFNWISGLLDQRPEDDIKKEVLVAPTAPAIPQPFDQNEVDEEENLLEDDDSLRRQPANKGQARDYTLLSSSLPNESDVFASPVMVTPQPMLDAAAKTATQVLPALTSLSGPSSAPVSAPASGPLDLQPQALLGLVEEMEQKLAEFHEELLHGMEMLRKQQADQIKKIRAEIQALCERAGL